MRIASTAAVRRIALCGVPAVDLFQDSHHGIPSFLADDSAIAKIAADFFIRSGFINFAFCGYPGIPFSDRRERAFVRELNRQNFDCLSYGRGKNGRASNMLKEIQAGFRETESLAGWVRKLPTPTCIFACNDVRAVQVLLACKLIKVQVPEQVAVLGVDNDELLAEFFDPKLSSIQPDTDFTAYKACEALDKLMSGEEVRYCQDYTEPLELVERESTNTIATNDPIVCEALKTIRKEACRGLRVNPN